MAEGRRRADWATASALLALLANCHRDPRKGGPFRPADFDPFADGDRSDQSDLSDLDELKRACEALPERRKTVGPKNRKTVRAEHRQTI